MRNKKTESYHYKRAPEKVYSTICFFFTDPLTLTINRLPGHMM